MLKSGLLSEKPVIDAINRDFVAVTYMIEGNEFPAEAPALEAIHAGFLAQREYKGFFATTVAIDPTGKYLLGYAGRSYPPNYKPGGRLNVNRYLEHLQETLERYHRVQSIEDTASPAGEKAARIKSVLAPVIGAVERLKLLHGEME